MNDQLIDLKIKKLIELCSQTLNYKKVAVVGFILLNNQLDEIGIRLGIRPRNRQKGEKLHEYMMKVNEILQNNFDLSLFRDDMINKLRTIEVIFLRKRGDLLLSYIKDIISFYYHLRALEVPDVYQKYSREQLFEKTPLNVLSFYSGKNNSKNESRLHPLLLQKIKEEERQAKKNLKAKFNPEEFTKLIQLKTIRTTLEKGHTHKISVQGVLKDNINYITTKENIHLYLILGWVVLFVMLTVGIIYQSIIIPEITMGSSPYLLGFFISCTFLIFIYRYYSNGGGRG
ncbi:MAG: hypothetical protein P8Y23_05280 [Candidatus Lokiarchaeota archaeon]